MFLGLHRMLAFTFIVQQKSPSYQDYTNWLRPIHHDRDAYSRWLNTTATNNQTSNENRVNTWMFAASSSRVTPVT